MQSFLQRLACALRQLTELSAALAPSPAIGLRLCSIAFALLILPTLPTLAGTLEQSQLLQAEKLNKQGDFAAAISILEPLVRSGPGVLDDVSRGTALDLLGSSYDTTGNYQASRRSYEQAIELLRKLPAAGALYAVSLADLGSLELSTGQYELAEPLLHKAQALYANAGDHAGLAFVECQLATLSLARSDLRSTRKILAQAFQEVEIAKDIEGGTRAAIYSIQGSLEAKNRDFRAAIRDYQQAIDLWTSARGPKYYLVALDYSLRADAYRQLGDYTNATSDIKAALDLVEQTVGRNTPAYASTELVYARVLHDTGAKDQAKKTENDAHTLLATIRRQQCNGCSITAAAFR